MTELDAPIETLEQAEAYFKGLGCSHFHMSREDFDRYDEYQALKVEKAMEEGWRGEEFERSLRALGDKSSTRALWLRHSAMYDLYRGFAAKRLRQSAFDQVIAATFEIAPLAPRFDRILISETILGRATYRDDGMIVHAKALGLSQTADALFDLVDGLLDFTSNDQKLEDRRKRALELKQQLKNTPNLFAMPSWLARAVAS